MADRILVSTEELENAVSRYQTARDGVNGALTSMVSAAESMSGLWIGDASSAFFQSFETLSTSLKKTDELMEDAIQELQRFSGLAEEAETRSDEAGAHAAGMADSL